MILDDIVCKRREQLAQEMARTPLEAVQKEAQKRQEPTRAVSYTHLTPHPNDVPTPCLSVPGR